MLQPSAVPADPPGVPTFSAPPLRSWQTEALEAWRAAALQGIVEAVTGTGKTRVGIAAIAECLTDGGRAAVLVPTLELQAQWVAQLRDLLPRARVTELGGGARPFGSWDVVVAVVNTAARSSSAAVLRSCTLLVADECHRYGASVFAGALRQEHHRRLGLTATLERQDDGVERFLLPYFGAPVFGYDYTRAVPEGTVAPFRVALLAVALTEEEQLRYDELTERVERAVTTLNPYLDPRKPFFPQVAELACREDWTGRVAAGLLKLVSERRQLLAECRGKRDAVQSLAPVLAASRSLVFTDRVRTAEVLSQDLRALRVRAAAVHSGLDADDRREVLRGFAAGRLDVVVAPRVLDEGIDVPEADLGVVLSGTKTRRQMVQRMGRVLRLKSDHRAARFVVAYAAGTVEAPGVKDEQQGFLTLVLDNACEVRRFAAEEDVEELLRYLGGPLSLPAPPEEPAPVAPAPSTLERRALLRQAMAAAQRARAAALVAEVKVGGPDADILFVEGTA